MRSPILTRVAISGAFAALGAAMYFEKRIQQSFRKTDYYKKSMAILKSNRSVLQLMGEPIKEGKIDLGNSTDCTVDDMTAKLKVNVIGPKDKGEMYLWATRQHNDNEGPWKVERLELALRKEPNRRLLVYDSNRSK